MDPENPNQGFMPRVPRGYRRLSEDDEMLLPRASVVLPHLQENEKEFLTLVVSGDVEGVEAFLKENPDFNVNCENFQGMTALLLAVTHKDEDMVEFLLTRDDINIGDCTLYAVRDNQKRILEMLLEKQRAIAPSLEYVGVTHSNCFPDYITPLVLAAQCGHYEIIEMLIERGHTISKPHSPSCRCSDCLVQFEKDDLLHAENLRLNLYRAVCNPAYMCHSSRDPILTSFQLSTELQQCAKLVPELRSIYNELAGSVSQFAVDLIACCRTSMEMELVLNQRHGSQSKIVMFPRLILAMDYKQKMFVAHPNTQTILEKAWIGDWHDYNLIPIAGKFCYPLYRLLMLPVILGMSLAMPKHAWVVHWNIPVNRMFNHIATYLVFLIIIFLESNQSKKDQKRKPPNSGLEPVIIVFVVGNIWNIIRMCLIQGPKRYFRYMWNWHAVISNMLFILTFTFWLASYMDAINNDQIDLERKFWHHLDPLLISEGCFAIAVVMTFFKLMFYCRLNYYLGPLQISLGKMCADIAKYLTIFVIIVLSFTCGLCRFYEYYDGMMQIDSNGQKTVQVSSFIDFTTTLKTFFWAILCMSPLESADVIIENLPGETENTTIINKHTFTEAIGYIAFAVFELLCVTMILNMLIATMSSTYQRVIDNLDIEWVFGKTDFYLEFMIQSSLPSPLNLIPTPTGMSMFMEWFQSPKPDDDEAFKEYQALMTQLVLRYFRDKDKSSENGGNDMDTIKQDLLDLKDMVGK